MISLSLRLTHARLLLLSLAALFSLPAAHAQFTGPDFGVKAPANITPAPTTDAALLNPAVGDLKVDPGDTLTVKIFNVPDYAPPVRVSQDGTVQLPLIGKLHLGGLTLHQAEDAIAAHLIEAGMYRNPQVTVQLTDYSNKFATVTGEMHAVIPILGERRLYDVLAAAGTANGTGPSLPPTASRVVTILRPGQEKPIIVDLGMDPTLAAQGDIPILPHDTIVIARVGVVYVLGAFKTQGAIPLSQPAPLTLMEATSLSGGAGYEGKLNDVRILRTIDNKRVELNINAARVFQNKAPDPVLQAGDIVFLPSGPIKAALKANGLASVSSLLSLLIIGLQYR